MLAPLTLLGVHECVRCFCMYVFIVYLLLFYFISACSTGALRLIDQRFLVIFNGILVLER